MNINPTQGSSAVVHTSGGKSAELKSQFKGEIRSGEPVYRIFWWAGWYEWC